MRASWVFWLTKSFRCRRNFSRPTVHCFFKVGNAPVSINSRLPGDVRAVHLRGSAVVIVGEAAPVAGGHGAAVPSHHAADRGVIGDTARDGAAGHGAAVVSHHAADTGGAGDAARGGAGGYGALVVGSHHAADIPVASHAHIC